MCECGIVAVMRRLLRKGLPLGCCVAYMLAGPIINVGRHPQHVRSPSRLGNDQHTWLQSFQAGRGPMIVVFASAAGSSSRSSRRSLSMSRCTANTAMTC